jgi:hypothetical protein
VADGVGFVGNDNMLDPLDIDSCSSARVQFNPR